MYYGNNIDIVLNYTLDNYLTVYGKIGTEYVRKSGYLNYYLLSENITEQTETLRERLFITKETFAPYTKQFGYVTENNVKIYYDDEKNLWFLFIPGADMMLYLNTSYGAIAGTEELSISGIDYGYLPSIGNDNNEYIESFIKEYPYYYNGKTKVYYDEEKRRCFTYLDATKRFQREQNVDYYGDASYYEYAKASKEFTQWIVDNLKNIKASDAMGPGNESVAMFNGDTTKFLNIDVNNKPEEVDSAFSAHKREIIRSSIENNLASAINNYDQNSVALDTSYHFKMPVISEVEWDRVLTNVSLAVFLQGLPTGFKTYNNYAIVTSGRNREYVTDDSMYFINPGAQTYHRIGCTELDMTQTVVGYRNSDFDKTKETIKASSGNPEQIIYYYKHTQLPCYYCIVNRLALRMRNIFEQSSSDYNLPEAEKMRQEYYKAVGRERHNVIQ